jgi:hypothetical protein
MASKESMGSGRPPKKEDLGKKETLHEAIPVSEKFLMELFSSQEFLAIFSSARKRQERYGGECGFGIMKEIDSDTTHFTAMASSISIEEMYTTPTGAALDKLSKKLKRQFPDKKFVDFGGLHFHPDIGYDPIIIPSPVPGDLQGADAVRAVNRDETGYDFPATEMIAVILPKGETKVLVYQEPAGHRPISFPNIRREIGESLYQEDIKSQDELLDILRHYGYKAEVVRTTGGGI